MEYVVLVDENDNEIGQMEKQAAHIDPHLHRAFSIFLFNSKGELLMQQRALSKYIPLPGSVDQHLLQPSPCRRDFGRSHFTPSDGRDGHGLPYARSLHLYI